MNKYSMNQISLNQFILIIVENQIGIGILSLPRNLAESAGTDGWISIILGWIVAILLSLVIIRIMEKNPGCTLFEILTKYFGKWAGNSLVIGWVLLYACITSTIMFTAVHIIKIWINQGTPNYMLMILFVIPIYMVAKQGLRGIGHFAELVFIVTMWMPFLLILTLQDTQWMNLIPIGKEGISPILSSVKSTLYSFTGFEVAFFFYPFLKDKKSASKGIVLANSITMLIYIAAVIVCFVKFSRAEIMDYVYPTLNVLKLIRLPFLERLEIICLPLFLVFTFMTIIPVLYVAALGASKLLDKQDHRNFLRIILTLWILVSFFYIPTTFQITKMAKIVEVLTLYFYYVFPIFLWIYGWIFHFVRKEVRQ